MVELDKVKGAVKADMMMMIFDVEQEARGTRKEWSVIDCVF